jgi:hypothetical protein
MPAIKPLAISFVEATYIIRWNTSIFSILSTFARLKMRTSQIILVALALMVLSSGMYFDHKRLFCNVWSYTINDSVYRLFAMAIHRSHTGGEGLGRLRVSNIHPESDQAVRSGRVPEGLPRHGQGRHWHVLSPPCALWMRLPVLPGFVVDPACPGD